ncbi:MAG: hypothetical protein ACTJFS_06335 [Micrococcaceae bacterium]
MLSSLVNALRPVAPAVRPGVLRLGVGAYAVAQQLRRRRMFRTLHRQEPQRFRPVGVVSVLKRPLPPRVADAVLDLALVANVLATAGVAHRVTGPVNAALQWWTLTYRNSWGMVYHHDNLMVLHQAVLGVTRSADALSVDALLRDGELLPHRAARRYGAIAPTMNVATCATYLLSGVAKVRSPRGWKWASGDTLRDQIAADALRKDVFGSRPPATARHLGSSRTPFGALAALSLAVELGAPIALTHPRAGQLFAVAAWSMHWGIRQMMGIRFSYNTSGVAYLSFIPWDAPSSASHRRLTETSS